MDVALIQNAEHDVDGRNRRQNQDHLRVHRLLEHLRGTGKAAAHGRWHAELSHSAVDRVAGLRQ
ncbi:hypothetical protein D3C86_1952880 [compost metagenome]